MTKLNILSLAKQGNSQAITALIARPLQAKGIIPQASLKGQCLQVMLESMQVPDQQTMVQFIHRGMMKLRIESIKTVKIYGIKTGQDFPAWSKELNLEYPPDNFPQTKSLQPQKGRFIKPQTLLNGSYEHSKPARSKEIPVQEDSSNCILVISENAQITKKQTKQFNKEVKKQQKIIGLSVISKILIISLFLQISFYILFVVYDVVWVASYYIYQFIDMGDATGIMAYLLKLIVVGIHGLMQPMERITLWISRLLILVIAIWLYFLHASLRNTERNYPISPWGAIARFIVPFYSIWGIWNIFATLAKRLKLQGGKELRQGLSLRRWLPWLYFLWIITHLSYQVYWLHVRGDYVKMYYPWFILFRDGLSLFLSIVWLKIAYIINQVMTEKAMKKTSIANSNLTVGDRI